MSIIAGSIFHKQTLLVLSKLQRCNCDNIITNSIKYVKPGQTGILVLKGQDYQIYYLNDKIVTYLVLCSKDINGDAVLALLECINSTFNKRITVQEFTKYEHADESEQELYFQKAFGDYLSGMLREFKAEDFLNNQEENTVALLKNQVNEFGKIIIEAQEELFKRDEKIHNLTYKSEVLRNDSIQFSSVSSRVRKKEKCNQPLVIITCIIVVLMAMYLVAVIACKGFLLQSCLNKS